MGLRRKISFLGSPFILQSLKLRAPKVFPVSAKLLKYKCKYLGISARMRLASALEVVGIGSIIGRIVTSKKDMTSVSTRCSTHKRLLNTIADY
jgi:hypothetical protein